MITQLASKFWSYNIVPKFLRVLQDMTQYTEENSQCMLLLCAVLQDVTEYTDENNQCMLLPCAPLVWIMCTVYWEHKAKQDEPFPYWEGFGNAGALLTVIRKLIGYTINLHVLMMFICLLSPSSSTNNHKHTLRSPKQLNIYLLKNEAKIIMFQVWILSNTKAEPVNKQTNKQTGIFIVDRLLETEHLHRGEEILRSTVFYFVLTVHFIMRMVLCRCKAETKHINGNI